MHILLIILQVVGGIYLFCKVINYLPDLYCWCASLKKVARKIEQIDGRVCSLEGKNANDSNHYDWLRFRLHMLEKEIGITHSFHKAEQAHPDNGFAKWGGYEKVKNK